MQKRKLKYIAVAVILLAVVCLLASCAEDDNVIPEVTYYSVTFDSQGGSAVRSVKVVEGGLIERPADPVRDGYVFDGWRAQNSDWSFGSDKVYADVTLRAVWVSADSIYGIEKIEGVDACTVTELKRVTEKLHVPSVINGYEVTAIGKGVFAELEANSVSEIVLPETVVAVGDNAFYDCEGISIVVKGALTEIGEFAFFGCDRLSAVTLGEGLEEISFCAFSGCTSLREIRLPASVLTVCENAFEECETLVSVMMHASTRSIEDSAFRFCDALAAVYYYGTPEQFSAIDVAKTGNGTLTDANLCIYSAEKPETDGGYDAWYLDEKGKVKLWT